MYTWNMLAKLQTINNRPNDMVIEVSCGGGFVVSLLQNVGGDVISIDAHAETLENRVPLHTRAHLNQTHVGLSAGVYALVQ